MGKRIIFFTERNEGHRYERFKEEAAKANIGFEGIDIRRVFFEDGNLYHDKNKILINENDVLWFSSNVIQNHYLIRLLKYKSNFIWPSYEAIDFSDKFITNDFFSSIGIPTPKTVLLRSAFVEEAVDMVGGFPCVIKKNMSSLGKHVEIVNSNEEIYQYVQGVMDRTAERVKEGKFPFDQYTFQLQQYIAESNGEDYRILWLDGEIIGCMKRKADNGFKANISLGGKGTSIEPPKELVEMAKKIANEGRIFFAGIDFIESGNGYLAIEINTSAQFEGFEKATGINVAEKIVRALGNKFKK